MDCRYEDDTDRVVETDGSMLRVLVVGDRRHSVADSECLDRDEIALSLTATAESALTELDERPYDCLVCTGSLPEANRIELIERVRDRFPALPVVLVAPDGSERLASEAISAGVTEYLPWDEMPDGEGFASLIADVIGASRRCVQRGELEGVEAAVEHAADAILITDADGVIQYVNPAFEELTGYGRRQAIGRTPRILKSGEQGCEYYERMWAAILDGEIWEEEIVNETRSGERYVAHQTVAPVTDEDGEIRHFVGIQRDVTKKRRLEEQLERSEATLSRLYEVTTDEDRDLEEKIETALSVCTRHLDLPIGYFTHIADGSQEILAATGNHEKVSPGATDPIERTYCRKTIDSDRPVVLSDAESEGWADDPAYEHFGLRCYVGTKVVVDGEVYGTLCFAGEEPKEGLLLDAQQSTVRALANWIGYELERERREVKLERQNERLEKFASAVSHDLRNPLNVAQAHAELSREDCDGEHVEKITRAHERMETIIDDTLTLAREGRLVESREDLSLERLAQSCWRSVGTADATLEVAEDTRIRGDGDKLRHIFENLFRNAVEHGSTSPQSGTPADAVEHGSTSHRSQARDDTVEHGSTSPQSETSEDRSVTVRVGATDSGFYVEDDGPGIPESERQQVFEYGYSTEGGSGFGLSIVETIVRAHGWSVHVTDGPEGGARFEIDTDVETEKRLVY